MRTYTGRRCGHVGNACQRGDHHYKARRQSNLTLVFVAGDFQNGDSDRFANETRGLSSVVVAFQSAGGIALEGMAISENIRNGGFATYVASGATCASACGVAWLGGKRRAMSANARIGFHAAYHKTGYGTTEDSGMTNAVLGAFLSQKLGLSYLAVAYLTHESGRNNLKWLTPDDARKVGIDVEVIEMNAGAPAPQYSVPAVPRGSWPGTPAAPPQDDGWVDYPHGDGWMPEPQQPAYAPQQPAYAPPVYAPPPAMYGAPVYRAPMCCMPMQRPMMMPRVAQ
jgi:ATP-dependent protease ClpP protease subunit